MVCVPPWAVGNFQFFGNFCRVETAFLLNSNDLPLVFLLLARASGMCAVWSLLEKTVAFIEQVF